MRRRKTYLNTFCFNNLFTSCIQLKYLKSQEFETQSKRYEEEANWIIVGRLTDNNIVTESTNDRLLPLGSDRRFSQKEHITIDYLLYWNLYKHPIGGTDHMYVKIALLQNKH